MIDIHTHLYFLQYDADRDETIRRAFGAGIRYMVSVGTEPDDWGKALSIAESPVAEGRVGVAVGIHPNPGASSKKQEAREIQIRKLKEFILKNRERIVAIGECGLEYFSHDDVLMSDEQKVSQKELFIAQIELAQELHLPLIVHTRPSAGSIDAYEDVFSLLHTSYSLLPVILHCYMGDTEITRKFLELPNVYFSFTGNITYPVKKVVAGTKDDLTEVVKMIPVERLTVETDCPFLAPQSHRGERNEPAYVRETLQKVAELKGMEINDIEKRVEANAEKIFCSLYQINLITGILSSRTCFGISTSRDAETSSA